MVKRVLPCLAVLAGVGLSAAAEPATASPMRVAAGVVRSDIADLGHAPATLPVRLAVTLRYRHQAELDALVQLQATPGSPIFRHFLTPAQFAAEFAPTPADYARVAGSLRANGFRVAGYPNRTVIDAVGSSGAAERYFATRIEVVAQRNVGLRYANATPASVPAAIADTVATVAGLDNVVKVVSRRVRAADTLAAKRLTDASTSAAPIERTSGGEFAGLYPHGIAEAYKYPVLSNVTGAGRGIAIVIDSDIANSDLTHFWTSAGVTRKGSFSRVLVDGINPGITGDVAETAIDTELTSGLAPGANIALYLIPSLGDQSIEDAYNLAVNDHAVDVVSSSFGGCELDDTPLAVATDRIAEQGASEGLTFVAASGDSGGYCEDVAADGSYYYEPDIVNSPASNPHFVAVGGTALTVNSTTGARVSETAWTPGGPASGGGGGVSSFWARPSYQSGVTGIAVVPKVKVSPPSTPPKSGFAGRNLPDLSLDASDAVGSYVAIYDTPDGGWTGYGGTSVAAPMFAALVVEQNERRNARSGFLNPALYATFTANGAHPAGVYGTDFHDITQGAIGAGWSAVAGYDQATGIGSIQNGAF